MKKGEIEKKGVIETYSIDSEGLKVNVLIASKEKQIPTYKLIFPIINPATEAVMDEIKQELITEVNITTTEILDPTIINTLRKKFKEKAGAVISKYLPRINKKTKDFLISMMLNEMLGLDKIEILLNDPNLEEIVINSANESIRVYHKKHGWLETNIKPVTEAQIQNYANIIARRVGRQVTTLNPLLDAHLVTGDRANAVLYPISTKGHALTIRKFARDPWTVIDLIKNKTCPSDIFAMIWLAIQYEMTIIISGGTGSGKTTLLNVCMPFIPINHRIVSIEQTRELQLPKYLHWVPLTIRQPSQEGKGEVTMLDLLINSLRMRPDRIVLGEIRTKEEAEVLFEAMHTGHSVYATLHADNVTETIRRLVNPPISVPANLLTAVNLNLVAFRDRRTNIRRIYQIGEFIGSEDEEKISVKPNIIYRWKPTTDTIVQHSSSLRLFEELSRHTGLTNKEINSDIAEKKKILDFMVKSNIRDSESVGQTIMNYYLDNKNIFKKQK